VAAPAIPPHATTAIAASPTRQLLAGFAYRIGKPLVDRMY
jgi:hypothetical protein